MLRARLDGPLRFTADERRSLASLARGIPRKRLEEVATLATPDTLLRWYRQLVAQKYTAPKVPPKPRTIEREIEDAIVRLARENRSWGYRRIVGELAKLGLVVSKSTVERVLRRHDLEPAPRRLARRTWAEFIQAQRSHLSAADFFSVEALTPRGLVRHLVFFVINLQTREVRIAGVT